MLIQAMPLVTWLQCSGGLPGQSYGITYSVQGPNMTTNVSGTISSLVVVGTIDAGSAVSVSISAGPPYTIMAAAIGATGNVKATATAQSANAIVTYGTVGGFGGQALVAFLNVRNPS
jgi:hypothetical protein